MTEAFTFEDLPPIEDCPELTWPGKRPLRSATWRPSRLKESYGSANDGWMNRLYCGDNLQVMAHLLRDNRGKVDLAYIDPPFGSNANYGSFIHPKGKPAYPLLFTFGETRFSDVWTRNEYLQFMYERLILIRELLSEKGSLFVHCDRCNQHLLRCLLDEVFGANVEEESAPGLVNEIVWRYAYTPVNSNCARAGASWAPISAPHRCIRRQSAWCRLPASSNTRRPRTRCSRASRCIASHPTRKARSRTARWMLP